MTKDSNLLKLLLPGQQCKEAHWVASHTTSLNRIMALVKPTHQYQCRPLFSGKCKKLSDSNNWRPWQKNVRWKSYGVCAKRQKQAKQNVSGA